MILVKKHVTDKYFQKKLNFQPKPSLYSALASWLPKEEYYFNKISP